MATEQEEILHLKGSDAKSFLEYMNRERSAEENESYEEADEFYNRQCKL